MQDTWTLTRRTASHYVEMKTPERKQDEKGKSKPSVRESPSYPVRKEISHHALISTFGKEGIRINRQVFPYLTLDVLSGNNAVLND